MVLRHNGAIGRCGDYVAVAIKYQQGSIGPIVRLNVSRYLRRIHEECPHAKLVGTDVESRNSLLQ